MIKVFSLKISAYSPVKLPEIIKFCKVNFNEKLCVLKTVSANLHLYVILVFAKKKLVYLSDYVVIVCEWEKFQQIVK